MRTPQHMFKSSAIQYTAPQCRSTANLFWYHAKNVFIWRHCGNLWNKTGTTRTDVNENSEQKPEHLWNFSVLVLALLEVWLVQNVFGFSCSYSHEWGNINGHWFLPCLTDGGKNTFEGGWVIRKSSPVAERCVFMLASWLHLRGASWS